MPSSMALDVAGWPTNKASGIERPEEKGESEKEDRGGKKVNVGGTFAIKIGESCRKTSQKQENREDVGAIGRLNKRNKTRQKRGTNCKNGTKLRWLHGS